MASFVIKNYSNCDVDEHYNLYMDIAFDETSQISKEDFKKLRKQIIADMEKKKFRAENIRLEYHIQQKLVDYHIDSLDILTHQIDYYFEKWKIESQRDPINMFMLNKISRMMNELIILRGQYNLGTPVVMFLLNKMNNQMSGLGEGGKGQILTIADFNKLYENNNIVTNSNGSTNGTGTTTEDNEQLTDETGQHLKLSGSSKDKSTEHSGGSIGGQGSIDFQAGEDDRAKEAIF